MQAACPLVLVQNHVDADVITGGLRIVNGSLLQLGPVRPSAARSAAAARGEGLGATPRPPDAAAAAAAPL